MSTGELSGFIGNWLPQIEAEMRDVLNVGDDVVANFYGKMQYHLGWMDEHFNPQLSPQGKRLRPIFCLLACAEIGGDPSQALPAAAAIELLHNFSLIHDDVEDGDEMRRHRLTVWKIWGEAHAINVGDGMFSISYAALQCLSRRGVSAQVALDALDVFTRTCLSLTEGQYLDLSFEQRDEVTVDEYMRMIQGKTAALVGASLAIGGLIGGAHPTQQTDLLQYGQSVGLAFQIADDILGIWGDPELTGKAAGNDILRRKKSLPLLYALNHPTVGNAMRGIFADEVVAEQLPEVMGLLEQCDARQFAEEQVERQNAIGLSALQGALGEQAESSMLRALADSLQFRKA